jgi:hypothetical protein
VACCALCALRRQGRTAGRVVRCGRGPTEIAPESCQCRFRQPASPAESAESSLPATPHDNPARVTRRCRGQALPNTFPRTGSSTQSVSSATSSSTSFTNCSHAPLVLQPTSFPQRAKPRHHLKNDRGSGNAHRHQQLEGVQGTCLWLLCRKNNLPSAGLIAGAGRGGGVAR